MATFIITVSGRYLLGLFESSSQSFCEALCSFNIEDTDVDVDGKPILSSPLLVNIIPAGASVSYAIIRGGVLAGGVYKFEIQTADSFGNILSSSTYKRYGTKHYNTQIQFLGDSTFNSSLGTVVDKKG
jgi:hypothetical protein